MKLILAVVVMAFAISGCSESVLDWRNASVSGGLVYEGDSNEPFSGRLTNIPGDSLPLGPKFEEIVASFNSPLGGYENRDQYITGRRLTCDTHVNDGYIEGETSCRERSGVTRWTGYIYEDGMDGDVQLFDATGAKALVTAEFSKGLEHGTRRIYSHKTGGLIGEFNFEDGKMHGEQNIWAENGTKVRHFTAVNGNKTGVETKWSRNGQKVGEIPYGDYGVNGIVRVWDAESGQLLNETTYVEGERLGRAKAWNEDGTVKYIVDVRADGTSVIVEEDEQRLEPAAPASSALSTCEEQWITAYRAEVGEDAMINNEQLGEWEQWCSEGRRP
ncbi:MAG: hypothetical protein CMK74_14370 [Pseudomonadales bacterium]|nr:hypothetical protein [Pseudomonadales bacterium]